MLTTFGNIYHPHLATMTEEDALLAAALSLKSAARLACADWLETRGRAAEAGIWRRSTMLTPELRERLNVVV
jgi:hypothetical protein